MRYKGVMYLLTRPRHSTLLYPM